MDKTPRKLAVRRVTPWGTLVWSDPEEPPYEDFADPDICVAWDAHLDELARTLDAPVQCLPGPKAEDGTPRPPRPPKKPRRRGRNRGDEGQGRLGFD